MPSENSTHSDYTQELARALRDTGATANTLRGNSDLARPLEECAELLEAQGASAHRVRAYRTAAASVRAHPSSVAELALERGPSGLLGIYGVGENIAHAIDQLARTGRWGMLARLRGEVTPEQQLMRVPGIGKSLAERIHQQLGIETLEELELAAHDGRLETLDGLGPRRIAGVRHALASLLSRHRAAAARHPHVAAALRARPSVAALLAIDARYRDLAAKGELHRIAPRRFNPEHQAWLPIMHDEAEGFHVHVLYSNTALAHKLGKTDDWVVIYYEREHDEGSHTVVTEQRGPLRGLRVVRGREGECATHYESHARDAGLSNDA
jgi:hypothetical protein